MTAYIANPCRGVINLDTSEGKKMISNIIAGLSNEDNFDMKQENIIEFRDNMKEAANQFCFGSILYSIPISHDDYGNITQTANLLTEPNLCPTAVVIDFAQNAWTKMETSGLIPMGLQRRTQMC